MGFRFRNLSKNRAGRVNVGKVHRHLCWRQGRTRIGEQLRAANDYRRHPWNRPELPETEKIGGTKKAQTGGFDLPETDGVEPCKSPSHRSPSPETAKASI